MQGRIVLYLLYTQKSEKIKMFSNSGSSNNSNLFQTEFNRTYISQPKASYIYHQAILFSKIHTLSHVQ